MPALGPPALARCSPAPPVQPGHSLPQANTAAERRNRTRRATGVAIAADVLNRMLDLGRPEYVRIA